MARVVLSKTWDFSEQGVSKALSNTLDRLDYHFPSDIETVVIKPNLMYYWDYAAGETTDPRVVSFLIDYLRQSVGDDVRIFIAESDASAMRTKHAFKVLGYERLSWMKDVELVNLSEGDLVTKEVRLRKGVVKLKVNRILLSADFIVNVPKLKVHRNPPVLSCALKNFFGLIAEPYKFRYHPRLGAYVAAINKLIKPNLVIADGLVALGKFPKKMGLLIGASDPLACDMVAAKIAGVNPWRDLILSEAMQEGIGEPDFQLIDPDSVLEGACKDFPRLNSRMAGLAWRLQRRLLRAYVRLSGDVLPPVLME